MKTSNKRNKIMFCFLIAFLSITVGNAATENTPTEEWNKTYGGMHFDYATYVQQLSDGGYIMTGRTNSFDNSSFDAWLIKTESNGTEEWNRTFGGISIDEGWSVQETKPDSGYIIAGHTGSFGAGNGDAWLIKTYTNGTEEWNRTFGGKDSDYALSVQQTSEGGYIVAGNIFPDGASAPDVWLIKTNENGSEEWNKTYGGTDYDSANSVQQTTPDGGYIMAGSTRSFCATCQDVWLIKTDVNGTEEWNRTYGDLYFDYGISVQQTSDGGYIVAGTKGVTGPNAGDFWLIKTNENGTEEWNRTYGGIKPDYASSVQQTSDGGYIVAGDTYSFGADNGSAWLIKTDTNGVEEWNKTFGGISSDKASSVQQTSDGGYIVAGDTYSFGADNGSAWLVKVGKDPTIPVPDIDVEKYTNGFDMDTDPTPGIKVGAAVTWKYVITNTGNVSLFNITLVDDREGIIVCPEETLLPGESMECILEGTAEFGYHSNLVTVTGECDGIIVNDSDIGEYYGFEESNGGWEPQAVPTANYLITAVVIGIAMILLLGFEMRH